MVWALKDMHSFSACQEQQIFLIMGKVCMYSLADTELSCGQS